MIEDVTSRSMRAAVVTGAGTMRVDSVDIPEPGPGQVRVKLEGCGAAFRMMDTSFFLGRQKLIASPRPGMALWREKLFAWMTRNSESAMQFFKLPPNRVIELGSQLEI